MEMGFIEQPRRAGPQGLRESEHAAAACSGPDLRPVEWPDLCARLTAANDLRRTFRASPQAPQLRDIACFHQPAAQMLAVGAQGGQVVNPMSSANCKTDPAYKDRSEANTGQAGNAFPVETNCLSEPR